MNRPRLTPDLASRFVKTALGHVTREYPSKLDHVMSGPSDVCAPRALHPVFYGSLDWHSCVHGYWLLTHLCRRFPDLPEAPLVRAVVDEHFTHENVAREVAYLAQPMRGTFERPYGWAWLLLLARDLSLHTSAEGRRWHAAIRPLAEAFARRFREHLPRATYPIRTGTHTSSAFGVALALEYAEGDAPFAEILRAKAREWYAADRECQAWEPGGDDFLSPALTEAECMRRVLRPPEFAAWLDGFLPRLATGEPKTLFEPAAVSDRTDGKIAHLDGLNLSRSWCFFGLARALAPADARRPRLVRAAEAHLDAGLPHVAGDYMGEHWLASFALLALEAGEDF